MVNTLRFKKLALIFCMVAMPWLAHAASLGKLSVFSSLGDPLNAEIDVLPSSTEEVETLAVSLASDAVYLEQGVQKTSAQADIQLSILKKEDGIVVKITTNQPVSEPFLDIIVSLAWKDGSLSREYTLLLDPPASRNIEIDNPTIETQELTLNDADKELSLENHHEVVVKKGDTLAAIAEKLQASTVNLDQLLLALYQENKQAFDGENMNRLRIGAVLKAPNQEAISANSPEEAQKQIQAHAANWAAYKNRLASKVEAGPATEGEGSQAGVGKISAKGDEKNLPAETESRDVLRLSKLEGEQADNLSDLDALKDDLSAKQNAISETDKKTSLLEKQIADMKQLIAIESKSLADAQNSVTQTKVAAFFSKINPQVLQGLIVLLVVFVLVSLLVRRQIKLKSQQKIRSLFEEPSSGVDNTNPTSQVDALKAEREMVFDEKIPELKTFDLSSISLDFEPVVTREKVEHTAKARPLPDVFSGDFSNLLKVESSQTNSNSDLVPHELDKKTKKINKKNTIKTIDFSDVETKMELAIAYIDMRDKRGAKKLLNEVLKDGNHSQKLRAQALLENL